jgi:hypothetical protein
LFQSRFPRVGPAAPPPNWVRSSSFRNKGITDANGTVLQDTKTGCEWWTFGGLRANATVAAWLRSAQIACRFDNLSLSTEDSPYELSKTIASLNPTDPQLPEKMTPPKFADGIPEALLLDLDRSRFYNVPAATGILLSGKAFAPHSRSLDDLCEID